MGQKLRKIVDPDSEVPLPGLEVYQADFLATRKEELIELKSALKNLDYKFLADVAHRWRGFSAPYGFQELGRLAVSLEILALSEDAQGLESLLNQVQDYLGHD